MRVVFKQICISSLLLFSLICTSFLFGSSKVRVVTKVDGIDREYFIHIPTNYNGNKEVPLVFMLHGTSGDGEEFYNLHGWTQLADKEGFLAVFPSSGRYKINDDGELKTITKWNTLPDANWSLQPGEKAFDDIKFLRKVIDEMKSKYKIDAKRVYLNGFSNGGQMAAKCAIEMSDVLAAVCSNAGSFFLDTTYIPKRKIPYLYEVGNKDYGSDNEGPEAPLSYFDDLISTPGLTYKNGHHYQVDYNCIRNFNLKREFTLIGDTNFVMVATHQPNNPGPGTGYEFKFVFVKGLAHIYPNGKQHPYDGVTNHWNWMKQYLLEDSTAHVLNTLATINGYGQGTYAKGDTIHIWAKQIDGSVFTHWSGDIQYLESPNEYHSRVIMPAKNIAVTANYATLSAAMDMTVMNIKGAERSKKLYTYFPADKNKIKGVVWFLHGTNGNPASMISDPDARQMMNLLMVQGYAVIAYYSEESEYDLDFNNDGEYRYTYGVDSTLLDIANVRAIRDTLIKRNLIHVNTSHAAIGWSAGGAFTEYIANSLQWKAAINHTSSGNSALSLSPKAIVPYLVSINENDFNDGAGPIGNQEARVHVQNYKNRGACAILHEQKKAPLYPERFDRSPLISEQLSKAIFEEIRINNGLDEKNYLRRLVNELKDAVLANPGKYPLIVGLSIAQREAVERQIQVTNAEHSLKADINALSLQLIEKACAITTPNKDEIRSNAKLKLYPNPTTHLINLPNVKQWKIYNTTGQLLLNGKSDKANVSSLPGGIYYVISDMGSGRFVKE